MALLALNRLNINAIIKAPLLLYSLISKLFFDKILETFKPLLITSKISLDKIPNISYKKPKTEYHIFSISNLS